MLPLPFDQKELNRWLTSKKKIIQRNLNILKHFSSPFSRIQPGTHWDTELALLHLCVDVTWLIESSFFFAT